MADEANEANPEDEAVTVTPFKIIHRGEDTVGKDDEVQFADFSPRVLPADAPEEEPVPKGVSAPAPAPSSGSTKNVERETSEKTVQTPASEGAGKSSQNENSKHPSSSSRKTG